MVSKIILRLSLIIGIAALAYAGVNAVKAPAVSQSTAFDTYEEIELPFDALRSGRDGRSLDAFDTTFVIDDMETINGWTHYDLTATQPAYWHVDNVPIGDANAPAWWVGDVNLTDNAVAPGGYNNAWQQHLESPSIDLSGSSAPVTLAFKARWKVESPGGEPVGYDMWDGWNLQVSTDGGTTWAVVPSASLSIPYTGTSSYAFGEQWCLGTGIPAYGGDTYAAAYTVLTANLNSYAGQADLKFRYSFYSDPGFSAADDSSYYGLIVDSIRVSDAASTLLSNDGVAGGGWTAYAVEGGGIGDTWDFEDSTAPTGMTGIPDQVYSWNAEHRGIAGLNNALRSPLISLPDTSLPGADPLAYQQLKMAYYVWCDLLDSDGDDDGSLDDLYEIYVSDDGGVTWTRIAYDYAYANSDVHPDAGDSGLGWVRRESGLSTGGVSGNINLTPWGGHDIYLEFRLQTDCNNDGGIGSGLHVDYPMVIATRAYNTDGATDNIVVPFPVTVGLARSWQFDFINEGVVAIGPTLRYRQLYTKPDGTNQGTDSLKIASGTVLNTNEFATISGITWTPAVAGSHRIRVVAVVPGDQDHSNDTTRTPVNAPLNGLFNLAVDVQPAGCYELAHHNRDYDVVLSNPRLVRYSPTEAGVPAADADTMDINTVQVMWNWDPTDINSLPDGTARCQLKFYGQGPDNRTPGALLYTYEEEIDTNETISPFGGDSLLNRWWEVDLSMVPELKRIQGDFWVEVGALDSVDGSGLPGLLALVTPDQDTTDTHNYTRRLDITGEPILASPSRFMIEVLTKPTAWPDPITDLTVIRDALTNDAVLRWSPANRATGYNVYRSNDLNNPFQTLLTATPIAGNTYTDSGVLASADKYFYVVTGVNE